MNATIIKSGGGWHHIGYLVRDMEKASDIFENFGGEKLGEPTKDEGRKIFIQWMKMPGIGLIELIASYAPDSAVGGYLKRGGVGPYHICYEVCDKLDAAIEKLQKMNFVVVTGPSPAPAIQNRRVAFLYNSHAGLIEILEKK